MSKNKQLAKAPQTEPICKQSVEITYCGSTKEIGFVAVYGPPGISGADMCTIKDAVRAIAIVIAKSSERALFPERK